MPRSASVLRGSRTALLGLAAAASLVATPVLPVVQAVITYDGALPSVSGVRVVHDLPGLHMAVVRGDAATFSRLMGSGHLRGLSPDDAVELTDNGDDQYNGQAVFASAALGGAAGQPGAGAGVRVAIMDTGVSNTPALNRASGRLIDAVDTSSGSAATGGVYNDGYGHGTFMADIVAGGPLDATGGRAVGVAPAATVLVVRVATPDGATSLSKVLAGLEWVYNHPGRVDVLNLSLSHSRPQDAYGADPLTDAIEAVRNKGVTVVVSAGNHPDDVGDPGQDPRVLTVGAADLIQRQVAPFSGSDVVDGVQKPDVVANGVHVLGLLPPRSVLANDPDTVQLGNGLYRGTGTSQATAVTSGLAALLLQAHPEATPTQVKASIRCAARNLYGSRDGQGLVRTTTRLCAGTDGQAFDGSGDATGESTFDASSWGASSWGASSWGASSWGASSWGASSWAASSWAASSWAASSWAASSWAASSWAASSWAASSWGASSWASDAWGDTLPGESP